ncbi:hypothetical protein Dsin_023305 [Dipteronia sinensis]|uniref:EF-hand domain-containing protein n=1 Tax=Dipteronia sinensis TaxID=43782 RepID=A0AAE0A344_9ROSI|nr:hypothetical protein Dsin_023305 [Dipteronia sinensis]
MGTISAINDVSSLTEPAQAEVTWQIIVGTIAGITPFVVAGVEFSKRIPHHQLLPVTKLVGCTIPTPQIQKLEHFFKKFDANGDGKISAVELGRIMSSLHNATDEELQKMMKEIDSDDDGFIDLG